jgi:hypothetical protein
LRLLYSARLRTEEPQAANAIAKECTLPQEGVPFAP